MKHLLDASFTLGIEENSDEEGRQASFPVGFSFQSRETKSKQQNKWINQKILYNIQFNAED